ncbi:MAG: TPM domain-containing protein [Spirochaetes bacterium]|nr:TPM domain-containing protein [Spirochaetota bacterium]
MYINNEQTARINDLASKVEKNTGIEVVVALVGKCDSYPEIPWKAFAVASSAGALLILVHALLWPAQAAGWLSIPLALAAALGAGIVTAFLSILWPAFGRLFLDRFRAETEINQYAKALFLERELFRTRDRTGILILISLFERRMVILPDSGAAGLLAPAALQKIVDDTTPHLRRKERFQALVSALASLEAELLRAGPVSRLKAANELPDEIIQRKGEER